MALPASERAAWPRISVVTVVRNGERMLGACLDSVAAQRYAALEHVVVDGASNDGTVDLLRRRSDARLRWVSERDGGIYDAMNRGTRLATGDYLLFLGADDILLADLVGVAGRLKDPRTVYYGDAYWPGTHRLYAGRFGAAKLARRNICQQAIFYPRAVFDRHAFDVRYRLQADWELNMRCFSDPAFRFEYMPVLVARYNDRDGVSTVERDRAMEADYLRLLWRHFSPLIALPLSALVVGGRLGRRVRLWRTDPKS